MDKVKISKTMSLILRHHPEKYNIYLDKHGWAGIDEMVTNLKTKYPHFSKEILFEIVKGDKKQRYSLNENKDKIRANQGHSISVDVELKSMVPPDILYHGTAIKFLDSIMQQGLLSKNRLYVHLSKDVDTAIQVGQRHGKPVVLSIDCKSMIDQGYVFYLSENGVWLTKNVPVQFINIFDGK